MSSKNSDQSEKVKPNRSCAVAIVGLSGRFPGGASSPEELWDTLICGRDAVGEIDGNRWDLSWHNSDQDRADRIYTKAFGCLDQIDGFDAEFFGISPREAQQIDPQQRLLLELAWEAFEDAGLPPRSSAGHNIGVYVGISSNDYAQMAADGGPDAYSNTGSAFSIAANRISYVFDLHGPSFAVDTACSSSLVCLHQAAQAVHNGECDAALAGGVSVLMHTRPWLGFARASMLSPDGRCKSFDESGNGYVRSEGGGLVLLKRLTDAEADEDRILGVLRGTGINSDGRTMGLSMPNGDAQAALLKELYEEASIAPERVFYVEAHGTGTSVGDPIECESLGKVLGATRTDNSLCHIGSVKSNIGHLEPASGIAGLAKVLLSLKHRTIPANLHYNTPNPKIEFEEWRLKVVDQPLPLPEEPVVIGINSFGFGGANAHAIVEEYRAPETAAELKAPDHLLLSASSMEALRATAAEYVELFRNPKTDYAKIAHAAVACRSALRMRLAVSAKDAEDAARKLEAWLATEAVVGVATGSSETDQVPTAFVFSGNGPQWWGMGRELLATNGVFRAKIERIDGIFQPLSGWSLLDEMAKPEAEERIAKTEVSQPMLFAQQIALTEVLQDAGINPAVVFGHSVGEVAAACISGALTLEQATQVIFHRSQEQASTEGVGKMAALSLSEEAAKEAISDIGGWLEIAAVNGPSAVTVAGDENALAKLVDKVTEDGQFARVLKLDYPFHTKAMETTKDNLLFALGDLSPATCQVPFVSTVAGAQVDGETLDANYWFANVRQPVKFAGAVSKVLSDFDIRVFIEIGPHPVLKDYVDQTAKSEGAIATSFGTLRRPGRDRPESDLTNLCNAIAQAHACGSVDLQDIYQRPAQLPDLPKYQWQRERHWRGAVPLPNAFIATEKVHPMLGARLPAANGTWESALDKNVLTFLADHVVQDSALFPAAGYVELLFSAADQKWGHDQIIDIEDFQIIRPLVLTDQFDPIVQTSVDDRDDTVEVNSRKYSDSADHQLHVRGRLSVVKDTEAPKFDIDAIQSRMPIEITSEQHYQESSRRGLDYGPFFQGITKVQMTDPSAMVRESLATIRLDYLKEGGLEDFRCHPAVFDSCIQGIIPLVAQLDKRNVSTIPVSFEQIRNYAPLPAELLCHVRIERESVRSVVAELTLLEMDGTVVLSLRGARCQKANLTGEMASPFTSEWWRPDTAVVNRGKLSTLTTPEFKVTEIAADRDIDQAIERIAQGFVLRALDMLRPEDPTFTLGAFAKNARIGRAQGALLTRMLEIAVESGHVTHSGKAWTWGNAELADIETLWTDAFRAYPAHQAELLLILQAGDDLAARLKGEDVAPPNAALSEQLHDTAPFAAQLNKLTIAALQDILETWPQDRPMRVLELCGGTGGLTSWILPSFPADRADYCFTDVSEVSVARVERRLAAHKFMRAVTANPETDLVEQGLPQGYFDLVIGTGLHILTGRPGSILENIEHVMADGAKLLIVARSKSATGFLIDDVAMEIESGVMRQAGLTEEGVLRNGGVEIIVGTKAEHGVQQALGIAPERFLILSQGDAFASEFDSALTQLGHKTTLGNLPTESGDAAVDALQDILNEAEPQRIVFLGGTDNTADLHDGQVRRTMVLTALVRALELVRQDRECSLLIATQGAFATASGGAPVDPAEATLWGMGRVIGNEYPGLNVRLVDLHGADATALASEVSRFDAETEVQLVDGHRYVNRERITTPANEARHSGLRSEAYTLDFAPQGGLDSLHLRELDRAAPAGDDVEIAVKAAGLNFRDVLWCMGMLPEEAVEHGFSGPTIGMECAGEVVRVGSDVTHVKPGDRVMAFASSCFGTHVKTAAKSVAKMPDGMSYPGAATVPTVFLTAWYGLDYLARLEPGETIVIHGAAGGVGLAAIQIAKMKGAVVIGTAGSPSKRRMLEMLGVDHVLNSRTLEFADKVMEITNGEGVDVVLNSLAGEAILKNLRILKPFGRFLEIGKRDFYENSRIGLRPFRNNLSYFGIDADTLLIERPALAQRMFSEVIGLFASRHLTPLPHQVFPLSRASEAFRTMQQARHVGKLVVSTELDRPEDLHVVLSKRQVREGGTYLVTGGLGGFGLATSKWLVEQGANSLALVSRSGASRDEAKAAIRAFEEAGVSVRAFVADVAQQSEVEAVLSAVRVDMPPLVGVIHAAAVIEDSLIENMTEAQVSNVFSAKMLGAAHLHELTQNDPIETFVLYSSVSSVLGNPGQGAYVAANLYLDALCELRQSRGLPALSVGWGAILDAGFLTRHEDVRDMLKSRAGLDATPAEQALADLDRLFAVGATRTSVARLDLSRLKQILPAGGTPRFEPILPDDTSAALQADETLADLVKNLPIEEQRGFVLNRIVEATARVLGTNADLVNPQIALGDLGLDSLMAVELAGSLEKDVGGSIPVMQLLAADSLTAIADFVFALLGLEQGEDTSSGSDGQSNIDRSAT